MKVLIADDDPVSRRLLESYLRRWDYEVEVTTDGEQAWQKIQSGEFPIVICDWMMPKIDGPDLIRRIREQTERGYIYTILLTSKSNKGDFVEGMQSGADEFVSKPFDHDELHARLRAAERIVNLERSLRAAKAVLERDAKG
jgi:DNA-binding response OmpR family regulator